MPICVRVKAIRRSLRRCRNYRQDYEGETRSDMYECARYRMRLQISAVCTLLQSFNEVKIGQQSAVAVHVGVAVWRGKNRADKFNSGRIGRHEFSPESPITGGDIQAVNLGRQITTAVHIQGMAIRSPGDWHFSRLQSFNRLRIA